MTTTGTAFFPSAPKYIGYDRVTKDYMASYDGNVIGFFPNYSAAEEALNDYVLGLCEQGLIDQPLAALADPDEDPIGDNPFGDETPEPDQEDRACVPDDQPADDFSDCPAGPGEPAHARAVNLNDAPVDPVGGDGCGLIVAGAAAVTAIVLAALLRD